MNIITKKMKKKSIPLVSIGLIALLLFSSGCLNNNIIGENECDATIHLPKDNFNEYEDIQFEIENTGDTLLEFGRAFNIEYYDEINNTWTRIHLDLVWTEDVIFLSPGETFDQQTFNPSEHFTEDVKEGLYKINKSVTCTETEETLQLEKEFNISEN